MFCFQPQPAVPSSLSLSHRPISDIWQEGVSGDSTWGPGLACRTWKIDILWAGRWVFGEGKGRGWVRDSQGTSA